MFDLVLKGGRVIDPAQSIDERLDVAFADDRVSGPLAGSSPPMTNEDRARARDRV
jgi:predicted amidohydrolase